MKYWMKGAICGLILGIIAELTYVGEFFGIYLLDIAFPVQLIFIKVLHYKEPLHGCYAFYPLLVLFEIMYFGSLGIVGSYIVVKVRRQNG